MYLTTVLTHEITVLNQFDITTAEISLRLTWVLNLLATKDAINKILFLDLV